jgi:MFS family permease
MHTSSGSQHSRLVSRSPIFYGWIVWLVATIGWIGTSPGQNFNLQLFVDDFIRDYRLDRTTLSVIFAIGTFIAALSLTWFGRKIDRYGNRRVGIVIVGLFVVALLAWSQVHNPVTLLMGFIAIRALGQGALSLVSTTAIASWFWRRRGLMMSLSLTVFSLWQAAYVPIVQRFLETMNWHQVWILLGIGTALIVLPCIAILMRDHPEDYGLQPDGNLALKTQQNPLIEDNWTLRESMHTPIFWIFLGGRVVAPGMGSGLILHQVSIFASMGYEPRIAAENFALATLIAAGFSLVFGYMIDHTRPGYILFTQLAALIGSVLAAATLRDPMMLLLYALTFGIVLGAGAVFDTTVWTNLFGRTHQGEIRGFVSTILVIATALGPVLFGLSYDYLGSYVPVLLLGVVLAAPPMILCLFMDKPIHRAPATLQPKPAVGD